MRRQFKEWLRKIKNLNVFIVLFFVLSVGISFLSFLWAADNVSKYFSFSQEEISNATQTGKNIGSFIRGTLGSSSAVNQKLLQPLLTPTLMLPLNGNESQAFQAQLSCPNATEFLKVTIYQGLSGDLTLDIAYDRGFTGSLNTPLKISGVSAICSNGFMICNPSGTIDNCISYTFYLNGDKLDYKEIQASTQRGLSGCFCVNNACGGSSVVNTNLEYVLRVVGGMVVSAFLNNPSMASYAVSDSKIDIGSRSITFYGQDSSQCKFANQGSNSSDVQNLKTYYKDANVLSLAGNYYFQSETKDPNSTTSLVYGAALFSTGNVKTCVIKKVVSSCIKEGGTCSCTIGEKTEGNCNISSSCQVIEEFWNEVPVIQGGVKTGHQPIGNCITDDCGKTTCYDWTTKRVVYICTGEGVFNPSPRVDTVSRSATWDRSTGMVYYNDTIIPDDCRANCPPGYQYNYASKKCEAYPACPSGYSFNSTVKACISTDPNVCQISASSQESCNDCPSGYVYNSTSKTCMADLFCPEGGTLFYDKDSLSLKCITDLQGAPNCPLGTQYDIDFNVCYFPVSCSLGSFDPKIGQCTTSFSCPAGSYDSTAKVCRAGVMCPQGFTYNSTTEKCEGPPSCPQGSEWGWDNEIKKCVFCSSGYNSATQKCVNATEGPQYFPPCPENTIFNSESSLCEGGPCPPDFVFNRTTLSCEIVPNCPSNFSFSSLYDTCIATPNCPSGFQPDTSRGRCVINSSAVCPPGYVYGGSGKCIMTISCPNEGTWDTTFGKCVRPSFCGLSGNYCVASPNCFNGGVWNENIGKCIIETPCSKVTWVADPQQKSFYLGKGEESPDCELLCKVAVIEPKTDVYMKSSSTIPDLQYGTKTEKNEVSVGESYYYKPCVQDATGQWTCPLDKGEKMVLVNGTGCHCVGEEEFKQAAIIMQVIRQAGQDYVCSSGKLY
jgi:hypothetical protein